MRIDNASPFKAWIDGTGFDLNVSTGMDSSASLSTKTSISPGSDLNTDVDSETSANAKTSISASSSVNPRGSSLSTPMDTETSASVHSSTRSGSGLSPSNFYTTCLECVSWQFASANRTRQNAFKHMHQARHRFRHWKSFRLVLLIGARPMKQNVKFLTKSPQKLA